jgi:hypothetical protein
LIIFDFVTFLKLFFQYNYLLMVASLPCLHHLSSDLCFFYLFLWPTLMLLFLVSIHQHQLQSCFYHRLSPQTQMSHRYEPLISVFFLMLCLHFLGLLFNFRNSFLTAFWFVFSVFIL